jgi:transaldolase
MRPAAVTVGRIGTVWAAEGSRRLAIDPTFHFYVDSADADALAGLLPHALVYGVTTNPTSLRRAGVQASEVAGLVERVLGMGVRAVHVQVQTDDPAGIVQDAERILALGPGGRVIPKIPATRAGFDAGMHLIGQGAAVTYTAVFDPEQALFAAIGGAAYAAPYLGRMSDSGADGLAAIARMQAIVERYGPSTRLLVASVRSRDDFAALLDIGVGAITVPVELAHELLERPTTTEAGRAFLADAAASR